MEETMAKKAANDLLAKIQVMEPVTKRATDDWFTLLLKRNPETAAEIKGVIDDFLTGGQSFRVLKHMSQLHTFLIKHYKEKFGEESPLRNVTPQAFAYYCKRARAKLDAQK
jgi:hypothetical protein